MGDSEGSAAFPHAILELRWEGQSMPHMVQQLDGSHLVRI
jgi:SPX domain protein involved in polyphosphate accumulation